LIGFTFFLDVVDGIDDGRMTFSSEIVSNLFQCPAEISLGDEHQDLTRIGHFFSSCFRFQFIDAEVVILGNHLYEMRKILQALGIGFDGHFFVRDIVLDSVAKGLETGIYVVIS